MLRKICTVLALAFALVMTAATGFAQEAPTTCVGSQASVSMLGVRMFDPDLSIKLDCEGNDFALCEVLQRLAMENEGPISGADVTQVRETCLRDGAREACLLADFFDDSSRAYVEAKRVEAFGPGQENVCLDCTGECSSPLCCCYTEDECHVWFYCHQVMHYYYCLCDEPFLFCEWQGYMVEEGVEECRMKCQECGDPGF